MNKISDDTDVIHTTFDTNVDTMIDYVYNSLILKFGKKGIYNENIYSDLHKEFIKTLVSRYLNEHIIIISNNTTLIHFSGLEQSDCINYKYDEIETLALHLSLQLKLLEKRGYTMLYLQSADIIKVTINSDDESNIKRDFCIYLLFDLTQMVPLDKNDYNKLVLNYPAVYPFPKSVCAPELYNINMLPFKTHRSAIYYSLGLLCLHFLKGQNLSLNNLRDTPLFYFLERCLKEEPLERMCLFI